MKILDTKDLLITLNKLQKETDERREKHRAEQHKRAMEQIEAFTYKIPIPEDFQKMKFIEVQKGTTQVLINTDTIQQISPFPDDRCSLLVSYQKEVMIVNNSFQEIKDLLDLKMPNDKK